MADAPTRPYHHGDLRRTVLVGAVEEISASGPSGLSMRRIARRAGVSHAAAAHHFGDKSGVYTAIAAEGFELLATAQAELRDRPDALLQMALGYIRFAATHRAHFEVMWRPDLLRSDDPSLVAARDRAFGVFEAAVDAGLRSSQGDTGSGDELAGPTALAAWSLVHGFASLWLAGNLADELGDDPVAAGLSLAAGVVALGQMTVRQLAG